MSYFKDKVIWITGASSGIGEALTYKLSGEGASLILSSRRPEELERVKKGCVNQGLVRILPLDLAETATLEEKTKAAVALFGHIDIMVHNGGISQRSLVADTQLDVHRRVMEVDYFSYVALTHRLLPYFLERRSGHFVVVSSVMGKLGTPMRSSYAAAKHALHGFFDCLRAEVAAVNIQVTVLTPGYIRTNVSVNAVTADGSRLGTVSQNIDHGLAPDKAADQILRAIAARKKETYIGKFSLERISLWLQRFFPGIVFKLAPKFAPK
jgi:dehydrogenase/reductase SDR family protein 7B